jgi:hypothetical protein
MAFVRRRSQICDVVSHREAGQFTSDGKDAAILGGEFCFKGTLKAFLGVRSMGRAEQTVCQKHAAHADEAKSASQLCGTEEHA